MRAKSAPSADIPGIIGMSFLLRLALREEEVNDLYARAAAEERQTRLDENHNIGYVAK